MALKATRLKNNHGGFAGDHALYRLEKPLTDPGSGTEYDHVIVFSTNYAGRTDTIIVPGRPDGSAPNMTRLPGSVTGIEDHAGALWAAGGFAHGEAYEIVIPDLKSTPRIKPEAQS